jgi:hypothetical protein
LPAFSFADFAAGGIRHHPFYLIAARLNADLTVFLPTEQRGQSDAERVGQKAIEIPVSLVLTHRPPDRHHQRNGRIDLPIRPSLG